MYIVGGKGLRTLRLVVSETTFDHAEGYPLQCSALYELTLCKYIM